MKIALTGANGFLGSHLLSAFVAAPDFQVRALVRSETAALPRVELCSGDLRDAEYVRASLEGIDSLVHAAVLTVAHSSHLPRVQKELYAANVESATHLARACVEHGVKKVVFISSSVAFERTEFPAWLVQSRLKREAENELRKMLLPAGVALDVIYPGLIFGAGDFKKSVRKLMLKSARGELKACSRGETEVVSVAAVVAMVMHCLGSPSRGLREMPVSNQVLSFSEIFSLYAELNGFPRVAPRIPNGLIQFLGFTAECLRLPSAINRETAELACAQRSRGEALAPLPEIRQAISESNAWAREHGLLS